MTILEAIHRGTVAIIDMSPTNTHTPKRAILHRFVRTEWRDSIDTSDGSDEMSTLHLIGPHKTTLEDQQSYGEGEETPLDMVRNQMGLSTYATLHLVEYADEAAPIVAPPIIEVNSYQLRLQGVQRVAPLQFLDDLVWEMQPANKTRYHMGGATAAVKENIDRLHHLFPIADAGVHEIPAGGIIV